MNSFGAKVLNIAIKMALKVGGLEDSMDKIREALQGKKTYLVMIALIIEALVEYGATGDLGTAITKILAALGMITHKAGLNRAEEKIDSK